MRKAAALLVLLAACDDGAAPSGGGGHRHKPPHGGTLVELDEHFAQLEFVLDGGRLTLYLLDGHASGPLRIEQREVAVDIAPRGGGVPKRVLLSAVASVLTGEKPGDSSQFDAPFEGPVTFDGVLSGLSVRGRDFRGVKFRYPEGSE